MGFIARGGGQPFKQVPPGNFVARCYSLIDLGTQTSERFGNSAHKIRISWEVFGEDEAGQPLTIERDGRQMPMTVSSEYTLSLNDKALLRKVLASWRGKDFTADEAKGFDISKLLGAYCLLNVTNSEGANGKTYANVSGVTPLPKAMSASKPAGVHPLQQFDLDNPDMDLFESLPQFVKDKIESSPEWGANTKTRQPATAGGMDDIDDDVPF